MEKIIESFTSMSNAELLRAVTHLVGNECLATARLIASLGEVDSRRLYLGEGCSSLFTYCTQVLHLSEHAAYHRIEAARRARRFPVILERIADGSVTLTAVSLLGPFLTPENHVALLEEASHRSKREVEAIAARLNSKPDVRPMVRKLPSPQSRDNRSGHAATLETVTASSRRVPAAVKREVWRRDAGQCAFVGASGRCSETGLLEYHHVVPFAAGGQATVQNIALRCRRHNGCEFDLYSGKAPLLRERRAVYRVRNSVRTEFGLALRERISCCPIGCRAHCVRRTLSG